jgi:diadenosine tetraphosphatase ApaH/serine/threonine PP2A family protein phosphatase
VRYAVISDVHGNLEALEAVLADIERERPDGCICLGDVVGYGPDPNDCAARVRSLDGPAVAGNHDRAAAGALDTRWFNPLARAAIDWTIGVLTQETRRWLADLPERYEAPEFLGVHGSPRDPVEEYILDLPTSLAIFSAHRFSLCLVGHSHVPGVFVLDAGGRVSAHPLLPGESLSLDGASRYIVNVGSVGQPRDGDPRAAYLLLDTGARTAVLRRLPYAVRVTQRKMRGAGLPARLAQRLAVGR